MAPARVFFHPMGMIRTMRSVIRFRSFERDPDLRRMQVAANVADLRLIAHRRLPRGVFDYVDGGAEDEVTYQRNERDFHNWEFSPSVLRDVSNIDPSSVLLGRKIPFPLVLAPTGFTRIVDPPGELSVARAAAGRKIPYALSTLGTRSIEEVAEAGAGGRNWFQVYVWKDRGLVRNMIERADAAGYEALCITVDLAVPGRRERDVRNGMTLPPKVGLNMMVEGVRKPGWTWRFLNAEPITFANVVGFGEADGTTAVELADLVHDQFDPSLSLGRHRVVSIALEGSDRHQGHPVGGGRAAGRRSRCPGHSRVQPWGPPARERPHLHRVDRADRPRGG